MDRNGYVPTDGDYDADGFIFIKSIGEAVANFGIEEEAEMALLLPAVCAAREPARHTSSEDQATDPYDLVAETEQDGFTLVELLEI